MKKVFKSYKKEIIVFVLVYLYSVFTTRYYFDFSYQNFDIFDWGRYILIRGVFVILSSFIIFHLFRFFRKLCDGEERAKKFLKFFFIAFFIQLFFLILIWPGNWINDELGVLAEATHFSYYSWQNYLTVIYFSLCVMLIPTAISIPLLQITFISFVFSYIVGYFQSKEQSKFLYLFYIILLLPPVIYNNLQPLRITMYTFYEVLFLFWLYRTYSEKKNFDLKASLISIFSIFILSFWRSEGIYYLILPVLFFFVFRGNSKILLKCIIIEIFSCILVFSFSSMDKYYDSKSYFQYKTTSFINPLSMLLQEDLKGKNIQKDLDTIDKVIDISYLKDNPSIWNILVVFQHPDQLYRDNIEKNYDGVMKAYLSIVTHNFSAFMKERIDVFMITNGNYKKGFQYYSMNDKSDFKTDRTNIVTDDFLGKPINNTIRDHVLGFLRGEYISFIQYFWSVIPIILLLVVFFIYLLIKRSFIESLFILNLLGKSILIFLTTPATFFMYYYPLYLEGLFIICGFVVVLIPKIGKYRKERSISYEKVRS